MPAGNFQTGKESEAAQWVRSQLFPLTAKKRGSNTDRPGGLISGARVVAKSGFEATYGGAG